MEFIVILVSRNSSWKYQIIWVSCLRESFSKLLLITSDDTESISSRASYSDKEACHVDRPSLRCLFESFVSLSHLQRLASGSLDITGRPWSQRLSLAAPSILPGWTRSCSSCDECHWKNSSVYEVKRVDCSIFSPFTDVEHSRTSYNHRKEFLLQTLMARVLQWPVPVVVVVITKIFCAGFDFVPRWTIERHSHVVLWANPRRNFNLEIWHRKNE